MSNPLACGNKRLGRVAQARQTATRNPLCPGNKKWEGRHRCSRSRRGQSPPLPVTGVQSNLGLRQLPAPGAEANAQTLPINAFSSNAIVNLTLTAQSPPGLAVSAPAAWTLQAVLAKDVLCGSVIQNETILSRPLRVASVRPVMKHPATRELYEYWDRQRADAPAPERGSMEPGPIRHLIGDTFILSCNHPAHFPLRVAGTRISALIGRDLKGSDFLDLWARASRHQIEDFLGIATEECLATVAGVTAFTEKLSPVYLELLLLPFAASVLAPQSVTGCLVPLTVPSQLEGSSLRDLSLTTWRHAGHRPRTLRQRAVRRLAFAKGFMVYEGLRDDGG